MEKEEVYKRLGKVIEETYRSIEKEKSSRIQDQVVKFHKNKIKEIETFINSLSQYKSGECINEYKKTMQIRFNDFENLGQSFNGKFKVYLRGCGNAGKSTLMNALLSLDENNGAAMGKLPLTFKLDVFTDELSPNEAVVKTIGLDGRIECKKTSREKAKKFDEEERSLFDESKKKCDSIIQEKTKNIYNDERKESIENDIYMDGLYKTTIHEIRWGIGENRFFHNCILIDTPGLAQELRFTNAKDDVKDYEVDGIIWVVRATKYRGDDKKNEYYNELKEMRDIYAGKRVIFVINIDDRSIRTEKQIEDIKKKALDIYNVNDVICINAFQAYEGEKNKSEKDIEHSNIRELRKIINEMFVEKSSDEYWNEQIEKMNSFMNIFYKDGNRIVSIIDEKISKYDKQIENIDIHDLPLKISLKNDLNKILKKSLGEIKNRINGELYDEIRKKSRDRYGLDNYYIKNYIIRIGDIENEVQRVLNKNGENIEKKYKSLQKECIISDYQTSYYIEKHFIEGNIDKNIRIPEFNFNISFSNTNSILGDINKFLEDIDGVIADILKGIRDLIQALFGESIHVKICNAIEKGLTEWFDTINLDDLMDNYAKICKETLNASMEQNCGKYEDMKLLKEKIKGFISKKRVFEMKPIELTDMIGGI